ncbi:MAG TPA: hypothetical protein VGF60_21565, partial [Xanthobacteraceae bacterium]
ANRSCANAPAGYLLQPQLHPVPAGQLIREAARGASMWTTFYVAMIASLGSLVIGIGLMPDADEDRVILQRYATGLRRLLAADRHGRDQDGG